MDNSKMGDSEVHVVLHKLCGEPIFYYFGSIEDAETLRNFDNIITLDGSAITPDDIRACKNCGVKINLAHIEVVKHTNADTDDNVEPSTIEPPIEEEINEIKGAPKSIDNFWVNTNDPERIYRNKPKSR